MRRLLVAIGVASMMTFAVPSVTLAQRTGTVSAQLTIDSARAAETLDLSRYSLSQGGLSSQTMINIPAVADLHPRSIRFFIQEYYNLYPGHGVYHWDTLDRFLTAVVATGARPIATIAFKPKVLYPTIDQRIVHPTSYREWEELVYRLVKYCRKKGYGIQYWEISNEGDIGEAGGSPYLFTPDDYVIYYTHTANAVRRADPAAKVGGPALAGYDSPIGDALIEHCGHGNAPLDFISWHGYSNDVGFFRSSVRAMRAKLQRQPSLANVETMISEWNVDLNSPGLDPHFQPAFIVEMTRGFHEEGLTSSAYYHIRDFHVQASEFTPFMSPGGAAFMAAWWNERPQYDGIWDFQCKKRPSYFIFQWLNQLKGRRLTIGGETRDVRALAAQRHHTLHAIIYNYSGQGITYDVVVRLPSLAHGQFLLSKLDPSPPVSSVVNVRSGSTRELQSHPIRLVLAPFETYFLTAPMLDIASSGSVFAPTRSQP